MKNDKELGDKKEVKINKIKEQLARLREKLKVDNDKKESPVLKPKKIHHEKIKSKIKQPKKKPVEVKRKIKDTKKKEAKIKVEQKTKQKIIFQRIAKIYLIIRKPKIKI